jgi:hypothetical protein
MDSSLSNIAHRHSAAVSVATLADRAAATLIFVKAFFTLAG